MDYVKQTIGDFMGMVVTCRPDKGFGFIVCPKLKELGYKSMRARVKLEEELIALPPRK